MITLRNGHKKWKPPVADRPTLTLYAKAKTDNLTGPQLKEIRRVLEE